MSNVSERHYYWLVDPSSSPPLGLHLGLPMSLLLILLLNHLLDILLICAFVSPSTDAAVCQDNRYAQVHTHTNSGDRMAH